MGYTIHSHDSQIEFVLVNRQEILLKSTILGNCPGKPQPYAILQWKSIRPIAGSQWEESLQHFNSSPEIITKLPAVLGRDCFTYKSIFPVACKYSFYTLGPSVLSKAEIYTIYIKSLFDISENYLSG